MASNITVIGRTTRVRGRVTGAADLEIQGYVEGDVAVAGDVTVAAQGMVGANIKGRRLLVRGAVRGDLIGDESILLEQGARVVGDLRAPRIAIASGALVRGHVQTSDEDIGGPRAVRGQQASRPMAPVASSVASVTAKAVAATPPKIAAKPLPPPTRVARIPAPPATAAARRPPPPVVPALRSSKGQIAKKKER